MTFIKNNDYSSPYKDMTWTIVSGTAFLFNVSIYDTMKIPYSL